MFPAAIKERLFEASPVCAECGSRIMDIAHAEVDHVTPYSAGGATTRDNAQLTCVFCNRSKGARMPAAPPGG